MNARVVSHDCKTDAPSGRRLDLLHKAGNVFGRELAQLFGGMGNSNAGAAVGQNNAWQAWLGQLANLFGGMSVTQNAGTGQQPGP